MAEIKRLSTELQVKDKLLDTSGDAGTSGQVLSSTGTGTNWINAITSSGGTFSGNIVLDDGSGASPNIQFVNASDDDWYIYNDSNGKFQVQQNSTIRATFSSGDLELTNDLVVNGGTLQLGSDVTLYRDGSNILRTDDTLHANANIHVGGDGKIFDRAGTNSFIHFDHANSKIRIQEGGEEMITIDSGTVRINAASGNNDFVVEGNTDANLLRVDGSADKVGIGTSSPTQKLHVDGHTLISAEKYYYVAGTGSGMGSDASGNLILRQNDANLMTTSGSNATFNGTVGIGMTATSNDLDIFNSSNAAVRIRGNGSATLVLDSDDDNSGVSGSYLHYRDDGSTKWTLYKETNNDFYLHNVAASTYPIHAKANGHIVLMEDGNNLGVGASSPQEKLHVYHAGTARIEVEGTSGPAAFKATNSQGSFGWYVPSDANEFRLWNFGTSADLVTVNASGNGTFAGDIQAPGIYVGSTNTSYDFYNNGTTYLNGATTVDAAFTQSGGAASTFSGDVTVAGDLNVTGDINSVSVTDLDVTDKTITVGVGQTAANSGSSGILISRSDAADPSMLWNQSTSRFDFNSGLTVTGQIHTTGAVYAKGALYVKDTDGTNNHIQARSNGTEGFLTVSNGSNWGLIMRGPVNDPRIGAYHNGILKIEGFHSSDGATGANTKDLAQFDFGNERFLVNGDIRINNYTGSDTGGGGQTTYAGGLSIFENSGTAALFLGVKNASYANRGWSFEVTEVGVNSKLELREHGLTGTRLTIASGGDTTFVGTINAPDGNATTPSYNFTSHDGNGIYLEEYDASNNKEQVSIATDGTRRFRANEAGIWSDQNVYFAGSLRKFGEWHATSGTAGEGFKFENTADSTTPLTITSTGNATFAGDIHVGANYVGRDGDNYIGFVTDNLIKFRVNGATQVKLADGVFAPQTDSDVDLGSNSTRFANLYVDNIRGATITSGVTVADDVGILFGSGGDSFIKHTGAQMSMYNDTGHIYMVNRANDKSIIFQATSDTSGSSVTENYFSLMPTFGSVASPGSIFVYKDLVIPQDGSGGMIRIGASQDLEMYHDGTSSYIENNTGHLYIYNKANDQDIVFYCDDQSGGDAEYFRLDGGDGRIKIPDQKILQFGAGGDLQFKHDSTDSLISNYNGHLYITNYADDKDIYFRADDGNGEQIFFYLDGSTLRTNFERGTRHHDDNHAQFGNSGDMQIYHSSGHSRIYNDTGDIIIRNNADNQRIRFQCDNGSGGYTTYFDLQGSQANGTRVYTNWYDNSVITLGNGLDTQLYHDGTDTIFYHQTGNLEFQQAADGKDIIFKSDNGSGGLTEYFRVDGGADKVIFSKGIRLIDNQRLDVGGATDGRFFHDGTDTQLTTITGDLIIKNSNDDGDIKFQSDDGSGGTATYMYLDGGNTRVQFNKGARFVDSQKLQLGSSGDLNIFHDGSASKIENDTGHLIIRNNATDCDIIFQLEDDGSTQVEYMKCDSSLGRTTFYKETVHLDSVKARFGTGYDLQIQHTGTESQIFNSTGQLDIRTPSQLLVTSSGGENMIKAINDGAVELYHNNSKKFETTASGISVTNGITLGGTVEGRTIPYVIRTGFGDDASSSGNKIMPLGNSVTDANVSAADGFHFFIAPYAGSVKKIIMKNVAGTLSSSFTTELKLYVNGANATNSGELTAASSAITWEPSSSNTFSAGDKISFIYQKSASSKYWREVSVTIVLTMNGQDI